MDYSTLDDVTLVTVIAGMYDAPTSDIRLNQAIGELYDRYGRLIFTVAIHLVTDPETAEEITQDVFVRAYQGAWTYRPELAKVSGWLVSIARHRAIDELRKRQVRPEKNSVDWPDEDGPGDRNGLWPTEGPELETEMSIEQHNIRQMIATLPIDQRKVLGLAFFKGLSHNEIADLLGEPLGTVKSRIRIAMRKMRDAMIEKGMFDA